MTAVLQWFEHSLALPFFGIGMKTDLFIPVATAEFPKFAGILSVALSQHHVLGFEIGQLEFYYLLTLIIVMPPRASLVAQLVKKSACNTGDLGLIPGLGRSPGEGKGYPLQYSGLKNSMDCIIPWVTKSPT